MTCFMFLTDMRSAELLFQMHLLAKQSKVGSDQLRIELWQSPLRWVLRAIHVNPSCMRYWKVLQSLWNEAWHFCAIPDFNCWSCDIQFSEFSCQSPWFSLQVSIVDYNSSFYIWSVVLVNFNVLWNLCGFKCLFSEKKKAIV